VAFISVVSVGFMKAIVLAGPQGGLEFLFEWGMLVSELLFRD